MGLNVKELFQANDTLILCYGVSLECDALFSSGASVRPTRRKQTDGLVLTSLTQIVHDGVVTVNTLFVQMLFACREKIKV